MATISSPGIGSGLDVNSIVTQLVALEKAPLKTLQVQATNVQAQMSAFGQIQSQFSALADVATRIADPAAWGARIASSSNSAAATGPLALGTSKRSPVKNSTHNTPTPAVSTLPNFVHHGMIGFVELNPVGNPPA